MGAAKSPFFRGDKMGYHVGDSLNLGRGRIVSVVKDLTSAVENIYISDAQLVIKNAVVIDGNCAFKTDIAVTDGRISALGKIAGKCRSKIDAEGLIASAGDIRSTDSLDAYALEDLLFSGISTIIPNDRLSSNDIKHILDIPLNYFLDFDTDISRKDTARGLLRHVGKVSVGMIADLYFWRCEDFHILPEKIIKYGRCIYDRSLTDRRDIIYVSSFDTSFVPARSSSVIFTPQKAENSYLGRLYKSEHTFVPIDSFCENYWTVSH